ncbi:galactosylgalactosylxylosylprotein 3-beta-glucuronosyltransferase I [Penaeus vannamei]|uniref:galactosylgalactosylxylosylprotein 3-beta-glucuronosyltransferase I n=1 Tax=Penaeus vannamei TaxID=6689 RepID=UPI00387F4136
MTLLNPYRVRRKLNKYYSYIVFLLVVWILWYGDLFSFHWQKPLDPLDGVPRSVVGELIELRRQVRQLKTVLKQHRIPEKEYSDPFLTTIYVITPTYARPHQKAELTRLKSVFLHIPALHWIVIEDAEAKTELVTRFLETSGLEYTHLHQATPPAWKLKEKDPSWYKPRGVLQRNAGIEWLRKTFASDKNAKGVVYFADDDNTYSIELFKEMRDTSTVSVWPVALVGGVMVERPHVSPARDPKGSHNVIGWLTGWRPERPFATDMAGFAVNMSLLLRRENVYFSLDSQRGHLESDFLAKIITMAQLEPKAELCTKVYVWHTRTEKPNMKDEQRLRKMGKATNEGIEV